MDQQTQRGHRHQQPERARARVQRSQPAGELSGSLAKARPIGADSAPTVPGKPRPARLGPPLRLRPHPPDKTRYLRLCPPIRGPTRQSFPGFPATDHRLPPAEPRAGATLPCHAFPEVRPELPELRRARVSLEVAEAREQVEQSAQGCGACERPGKRGEHARPPPGDHPLSAPPRRPAPSWKKMPATQSVARNSGKYSLQFTLRGTGWVSVRPDWADTRTRPDPPHSLGSEDALELGRSRSEWRRHVESPARRDHLQGEIGYGRGDVGVRCGAPHTRGRPCPLALPPASRRTPPF